MKLYIYKSKSNTILYMAKTYRNSEGKSTSKIIERLGTLDEVKENPMEKIQLSGQKNISKKKQKKKMKIKVHTMIN